MHQGTISSHLTSTFLLLLFFKLIVIIFEGSLKETYCLWVFNHLLLKRMSHELWVASLIYIHFSFYAACGIKETIREREHEWMSELCDQRFLLFGIRAFIFSSLTTFVLHQTYMRTDTKYLFFSFTQSLLYVSPPPPATPWEAFWFPPKKLIDKPADLIKHKHDFFCFVMETLQICSSNFRCLRPIMTETLAPPWSSTFSCD